MQALAVLQETRGRQLARDNKHEAMQNTRTQHTPPWPNGQGVGPLIRRLRVRVPPGVLANTRKWCMTTIGATTCHTHTDDERRMHLRTMSATARLAQSAERKALNLVVVGSSPTVGAISSANKRRRNHMYNAGQLAARQRT
jgi:hypothetical protein